MCASAKQSVSLQLLPQAEVFWRLDQEAAIIEIGGAVVEMHCFGSRSNIVQTNFAVTSGRARHKYDRLGKSKTGPTRGSLDAQHKPDAHYEEAPRKEKAGQNPAS